MKRNRARIWVESRHQNFVFSNLGRSCCVLYSPMGWNDNGVDVWRRWKAWLTVSHVNRLQFAWDRQSYYDCGIESTWELREFFKYATSLVIMLSLYMFQFTMLFTSWCICSDNIVTSNVALLIRLALTLNTSLDLACVHPARRQFSIVNLPPCLIWITIGYIVPCSIVNLSTMSQPVYC